MPGQATGRHVRWAVRIMQGINAWSGCIHLRAGNRRAARGINRRKEG